MSAITDSKGIAMDKLNSLHLIHNSFSTLILDAIQYFPQNLKKIRAESHGLLFGMPQKDVMECDYIFPVGNVSTRKSDEVENNPKVDQAINLAKQLLSTY